MKETQNGPSKGTKQNPIFWTTTGSIGWKEFDKAVNAYIIEKNKKL